MLWIAVWSLLPWLNAGAQLVLDTGGTSAVWEQSRALVLLNYAALSFAIVLTLWGTDRIARRLQTLHATTCDHDRDERHRNHGRATDPRPLRTVRRVGRAGCRPATCQAGQLGLLDPERPMSHMLTLPLAPPGSAHGATER